MEVSLDKIAGYQICPNLAIHGFYRSQEFREETAMTDEFEKLLAIFSSGIRRKFSRGMIESHIHGEFEKVMIKQKAMGMSYQEARKWEIAWSFFIKKFSSDMRGSQIILSGTSFKMQIKDFSVTHNIPTAYIYQDPGNKDDVRIRMVMFIRNESFIKKSVMLNSPYFIYAWNFYRNLAQRNQRRKTQFLPVEMEFVHLGETAKSIVIRRQDYVATNKYGIKKGLLNSLAAHKAKIGWPIITKRCKSCPCREACKLI